MAKSNSLVTLIDRKLDVTHFREQHWEGTFWDYLEVVQENPSVSRNAFQRVYDMILSYGSESFTQFKQEYIRYHFFADPIDNGADAIFGLERPLMQLVDFFKSAAQGYGTERRILLLHGPVGLSEPRRSSLRPLASSTQCVSVDPAPSSVTRITPKPTIGGDDSTSSCSTSPMATTAPRSGARRRVGSADKRVRCMYA